MRDSNLNLRMQTLEKLIPHTGKGSAQHGAEHDFVNLRTDDFGGLGIGQGR